MQFSDYEFLEHLEKMFSFNKLSIDNEFYFQQHTKLVLILKYINF